MIPIGVSEIPASSGEAHRKANQVFFMSILDKYHDYKGLDILLQAMARLKVERPGVRLLVGGGGDSVDKYRQLAAHLGITDTTEFLGSCPTSRSRKPTGRVQSSSCHPSTNSRASALWH